MRPASRRRNACSCVRTATPKLRAAALRFPLQLPVPESDRKRSIPDSSNGLIRGSSIRQSVRLLTEKLWVRVPPPELSSERRVSIDHEALRLLRHLEAGTAARGSSVRPRLSGAQGRRLRPGPQALLRSGRASGLPQRPHLRPP